jgi:hypothetical protein
MKVSDLVADLNNRSQNAQVMIVEPYACPDNILTIESVIKEDNEKIVMLIGKSALRKPMETFPGILLRGRSDRVFKASICKSDEKDGKFQVSVDGVILQSDFETEHEAKICVRGFVLGFNAGSGSISTDTTDFSQL